MAGKKIKLEEEAISEILVADTDSESKNVLRLNSPHNKHFFFFLCWHYNPQWVLAFSAIFFHSVLSLLSFLHPLIPIIWISSSASSIHRFLGCPLILLSIGFHSNILLGILPPSIRITCPSQAIILLLFINLTMSTFPISSFSLWFFLILQIPFSSLLGQIFSLIFSTQMSMSHIRMLLQVLLKLYIFLVLNFYLMLLISLVLYVNNNIGFC